MRQINFENDSSCEQCIQNIFHVPCVCCRLTDCSKFYSIQKWPFHSLIFSCTHINELWYSIFCSCLITNINNNVSVWFCFIALFTEKRISEEVDLNCTHFYLVVVVGPLSFDSIKAISWQYIHFLGNTNDFYTYNFMTKKNQSSR